MIPFHTAGEQIPPAKVEQQHCDQDEHREYQKEEYQQTVPQGVVWNTQRTRTGDAQIWTLQTTTTDNGKQKGCRRGKVSEVRYLSATRAL